MQLTVKELWRYPVKSMRGERLSEATVSERGVEFDRGWAVRIEDTQTIRGAKYLDGLLDCEARYLPGTSAGLVPHAAITLPDGAVINTDDARINERLSEVTGERVTLWPLQPAEDLDHYLVHQPDTGGLLAEMRRVMALRDDDPLPDFSRIPRALQKELSKYASPLGTYFDAFPMNVLTEASLRHLLKLRPDMQADVRRFRPNILVEDAEGQVGALESSWVGKTLALADLSIDVITDCPRCVMVTKAQADLVKDPTIMRTLVKELRQNLSVYCTVRGEGVIRVGDAITVG